MEYFGSSRTKIRPLLSSCGKGPARQPHQSPGSCRRTGSRISWKHSATFFQETRQNDQCFFEDLLGNYHCDLTARKQPLVSKHAQPSGCTICNTQSSSAWSHGLNCINPICSHWERRQLLWRLLLVAKHSRGLADLPHSSLSANDSENNRSQLLEQCTSVGGNRLVPWAWQSPRQSS